MELEGEGDRKAEEGRGRRRYDMRLYKQRMTKGGGCRKGVKGGRIWRRRILMGCNDAWEAGRKWAGRKGQWKDGVGRNERGRETNKHDGGGGGVIGG